MKVIDHTQYQSSAGEINLWNRIKATFEFGPAWYRDMEAQQELMAELVRTLDNRFVLLRNVTLPGTDVPIPMLIVGPSGVWVLLVSSMRGVYRAKGESWLVMDGGRFKNAKPNLVQRLLLVVRAFETHLQKENIQVPEIHPGLIFADPGMHVDSVHPAARVVLSDALDRFALGLTHDSSVMSAEKTKAVVDSLVDQEADSFTTQETLRDEQDVFSFREVPAANSKRSGAAQMPPEPAVVGSILDRVNLDSKQWVILLVIFGFWIVMLLAFAVIILFL